MPRRRVKENKTDQKAAKGVKKKAKKEDNQPDPGLMDYWTDPSRPLCSEYHQAKQQMFVCDEMLSTCASSGLLGELCSDEISLDDPEMILIPAMY